MLRLKSLFGGFVKNYALNKSYRSTFQIMEYASKLLNEDAIVPFVRKGKYDVEEIDVKDQDDLIDTILETLEDYYDENYEFDGVIIVNFDDNTDDLVKYIMATRALHRLKVINFK